MDAKTLDRLEEIDPEHYTEEDVLGLLVVDPDSDEAWQVRGAIAFWLEIPSWPDDATGEQAKLWRAGRNAAADRSAFVEVERLRERVAKALGLTGHAWLARPAALSWSLSAGVKKLKTFDLGVADMHTGDDVRDAFGAILTRVEGWTREGDKWTHVSGRCLERRHPRDHDDPYPGEHWSGSDGGIYKGSGHPALFDEVVPF